LPDPRRLAVPARPVVVRAAPALTGASRLRLPSAPAGSLRRPGGGVLSPPHGHEAPRGARFPRSARVRTGPGRAPSLPRERRCPLAIELSVAAACRLSAAGSCHPGTATQPGMSMSRGISKGFLAVALFRSFPSPVAAMAGAAVLGLFRELRTQPVRNRQRTSRRGQVEHEPVATSPASARPPRLAHSPRATSCRNNEHRPHQSRGQRPPLHEPSQAIDMTSRIDAGLSSAG